MSSASEAQEEDPLPSRSCESELKESDGRFLFHSWQEIEEVFAGSALKYMKEAGLRLGVSFTARDTWVQVQAEQEKSRTKALRFVEELVRLRELNRNRALDPSDFLQALQAYSTGSESDLKVFFSERIKVGRGKREIMPRTRNQLAYVRAIREKDIVFGVGPAGTGKTYLAMAMAISNLLAGKYSRIVLTRPAVEAGENLGFLPGKLEEKINPYLRPLYDALYDMLDFSDAEDLIARNIIEVAPLAFMRGRTLNDAFIILDEAQNTTREQMLMFLTRLGFRSQCVVCGDPAQTDLISRHSPALLRTIDLLRDVNEIAICRFATEDVVRHSLVEKIIRAFGAETEGANPHV